MKAAFETRIEWLDAPGVTSPELASTWARFEIWIAGRCATQVESGDGSIRRSIFGSLYPLAEWVASNWWLLTSHIRPSAVDIPFWNWANSPRHAWLRQHNFRGAGDGMAWPNLTIVPEGAVARVAWAPEFDEPLGPLRFVSLGQATVPAGDVEEGLANLVEEVLIRLAEQGLPETRLHEEWDALAKADEEERQFCRALGRLGLDPYVVDDQTAATVVDVASNLPEELLGDFFDSADVTALSEAAVWTKRALAAVGKASEKATAPLEPLYEATSPVVDSSTVGAEHPWLVGYAMARSVRQQLHVAESDRFDISPWIGSTELSAPSRGIRGLAAVKESRCGVVFGGPRRGAPSMRFREAQALGRVLSRPDVHSFVLSSARGHEERIARAFAAELLAPAEGIRHSLEAIGGYGDDALEAAARDFAVSPLVVRHQYDNQLAGTLGTVM
jgi:hypothetical protein